jgi:hypothetical protein
VLHTLPLFFIAMDWARWASLCVIVALLYVMALLLASARGQREEPQPLAGFNLTQMDALLVAWSFLLPAFGIANAFTSMG